VQDDATLGRIHAMGRSTQQLRAGVADAIGRRRFLHGGVLSWLGAMLPWLSRGSRSCADDSAVQSVRSPIKACVLVFHYGGPSHLETYDPKPDAPEGIRGEYRTIQTAVPGIRVGEHLPRVARIMDRLALVRSMHHRMNNHNAAAAEGLTGHPPAGGDQELLADQSSAFPSLGSAVAFGLGSRAHVLPYVALPYTIYNVVQIPGQTAGILGGTFDRFQVSGNPNATDFRIPALELPGDRGPADLDGRDALMRQLDALPATERTSRMRAMQERALELVSTGSVRRGFQIEQEPPAVRDRYGRTLVGQSLLLARRLVESGVNFVTVFDGQTNGQDANWDSHEKIFERHRQLIPPADQGLSALIEDLESRGLLASTLVVAMGEFGRTPRVNRNAGRDHWPQCYSVVLAGGGIRGGSVYGASDPFGAVPARDPVTPADLASTIFWRFGIDPSREIHDQTGRPSRLSDGEPLVQLFG
jgi:hypothetical protein